MTDGYGIPLGRVLAGGNRHDSPLLALALDDLGPLPDVTVHLDADYDSDKTSAVLAQPASPHSDGIARSHTRPVGVSDFCPLVAHQCGAAAVNAGFTAAGPLP